jgi:hypothetical protein
VALSLQALSRHADMMPAVTPEAGRSSSDRMTVAAIRYEFRNKPDTNPA